MSKDVYIIDDDSEYKKFKKSLDSLEDLEIAIGIHEDAGFNENGESILEYATYNHFGTENIPSRPFLTIATDNNQGWQKDLDEAVKNVLDRKKNIKKNMMSEAKKIGKKAVNDIKNLILKDRVPPPNKESTIKRKKSDIPLVDTKAMLKAIKYKISKVKAKDVT